ncbi:MAG: methyltransferase domain-containing protein [Nitrospirae bacterium]|nr:methyltransferase domain-containing protein [Nitrospirota bacterium]
MKACKEIKHSTPSADWLGDDLKSWSQSIRNGFVRAHLLFALHETGVFELLRTSKPLTVSQIAQRCSLDAAILEGVLNFMYHSDKVLTKEGKRFSLTQQGLDWLFTDTVLTMSYGLVGAASCIYIELVPVLRKEKTYGVDFVRRGDLVAKGSYYTSSQNYPWIIDEMKKLGVKVVADMGCGAAKILIDFCTLDGDIKGVGLDISGEALQEAAGNIEKQGLSDRISLVEADISKPKTYARRLKDVQAFNAIMVLHEFFRNGEDAVIKLLQDLRTYFPGRYLFLGELNPLTDDEYQETPRPDRIHILCNQYITHYITGGRPLLTRKQEWLRIFRKAGIKVVKVKDDFGSRLVEYVLQL